MYTCIYSTDHKHLNARSHLTREDGASAHERSMQHSQARHYDLQVPYECVWECEYIVGVHMCARIY